MMFSSIQFFVFFAVVFLLVNIFKKQKTRQYILLFSSLFFYAYWDARVMLLMLGLITTSYLAALMIDKSKDSPGLCKAYLSIGIVTALSVLAFFKYFNFFTENMEILTGRHITALNIILPVGISFYTFQAMSYIIDVYRGKQRACRSFVKTALYIAFFPQLVAGPIVRSVDFMPQLETNPTINSKDVSEGLQIFLFGLFKKAVIADTISVFADEVFAHPSAFDSATVWLAVISYSIQIYCDFSGYSDMAIGTAKCLGYRLGRNFNVPYISQNLSEFWSRWHISLSAWLKDYLYIPLGGNRKGFIRTLVNLMITMLLGGLWHGAGWNFVIWGGLHGLALVIHKIYLKASHKASTPHTGFNPLNALITYVFVCLCWIFFRSSDLNIASTIIRRMLEFDCVGIHQMYLPSFAAIAAVGVANAAAIIKSGGNGFYPLVDTDKFSGKLCISFAALIILCLGCTGANPFIYFKF